MSGVLVFVPCDREQLAELAADRPLGPCTAHAVTPDLVEAFDLPSAQDEDAERGCLLLASVAALSRTGARRVVVAEVPSSTTSPGQEAHNGELRLSGLSPRAVQSCFADEPGQPLVGPAAAAAKGLGLDEAWELPQVQALLAGADLLWHASEEISRLAQQD